MYLGLSGGIGSGKSTVAKILSNLGAVVIDADVIAREVLEPNQAGYQRAIEVFGESILDSDLRVDRKMLAELVFQNSDELAKLEAIVHPAVIARVAQIRNSLPESTVVVYDTPLLFEKNLQGQFDKVLIVVTDSGHRKARLIERGLEITDIEARIANQATDAQRRTVADFVIENNGSPEQLQDQVTKVWQQISA
ncbi:MAG: dephospho-CoA kinase [Actinobacteria bacterium]|nr:dephospho-CoA kinase [Actinomycetota bacterium]